MALLCGFPLVVPILGRIMTIALADLVLVGRTAVFRLMMGSLFHRVMMPCAVAMLRHVMALVDVVAIRSLVVPCARRCAVRRNMMAAMGGGAMMTDARLPPKVRERRRRGRDVSRRWSLIGCCLLN